MTAPPARTSRIRGCLLGGVIGDALRAAVPFDSLEGIRRKFGPNGITGYAEQYGRLGAITDDTQMTLFTAEGLIRARQRLNDRGVFAASALTHGHPSGYLAAGALHGEQGLPADLLDDLEGRTIIEQLADDLASEGPLDWQRYPPN